MCRGIDKNKINCDEIESNLNNFPFTLIELLFDERLQHFPAIIHT